MSTQDEGVEIAFTGERLHAGSSLFGVDLARHRAAYAFAATLAAGRQVLDLGCGSGYGAHELASASERLIAVDRVRPDPASRRGTAHFVRADIAGLPIAPASFDLVVSFQVIEHLEDPTVYLAAMARLVRPGGTVLITTPNVVISDRVNPFHVHEYESAELKQILESHFADVDMRGIGMTPAVGAYHEARLARIHSIMRLDVLNLQRRLPRAWIEWAFGTLAKVVRRGIQRDDGLPEVSLEDFPIGAPTRDDIDLLAICRSPRG